jgi:hypothetical protein
MRQSRAVQADWHVQRKPVKRIVLRVVGQFESAVPNGRPSRPLGYEIEGRDEKLFAGHTPGTQRADRRES